MGHVSRAIPPSREIIEQNTVMRATEKTTEHWDLIIKPGGGIQRYWRDLWAYRELFYFLAWRDVLVQYKQTVICVARAMFTNSTIDTFDLIPHG